MSSILVTGACSGIGLAITKHFASTSTPASPNRIAMLDISATTGPQVAEQVSAEFPSAQITFRKSDVRSWEEQASVFKELYSTHLGGKLDIVVANAGVSEQGRTSLVTIDGEEEPVKPRTGVLDINLLGVVY
ncbi:hypothetical protein QBC44DRAFT_166255, partial [Cladorrhinum sp. PSN332]